jgi:hypothetical protein
MIWRCKFVVHDVKVHDAESAYTRGREIKGQGRAQTARANTEHFRSFQLLLSLHAHLGHDQMARVTQDFIVA